MIKKALTLLLASLFIGCQNSYLGTTETGALGGAAVGAGLGAIVGNQVGSSGAGIAIGAGIGALSGALIGRGIEAQEEKVEATDKEILSQEEKIAENRRLIDELRRRGQDVRETDRGIVVNLPDVLFEFDRAALTSDALRTTAEISDVVRSVDGRRILIEGHTDSVGTMAYNQRLSEDRARSVADSMVSNGVPKSRIWVRGLGERDPVASNRTDSGRARNRRVEVVIENR